MKDNSETRGSTTGTKGKNQADSNIQMKGSQPPMEGQRPAGSTTDRPEKGKPQPTQSSDSGSQQSGTTSAPPSHAGSTGSSGGQISPQTHDSGNAGRGQRGAGAGSGSSGRGKQNS